METTGRRPEGDDTQRIVDFLMGIGLVVEERDLPEDTFLPGITVRDGTLIFDSRQISYPGDLIHEAGHLAVLPPLERRSASDDLGDSGGNEGDSGGNEMAAIAWSYAACLHLGLPLEVVFHPDGYKGGSAALVENFNAGRYIGVPILEWRGMTDSTVFPTMREWLCPRDPAASVAQ